MPSRPMTSSRPRMWRCPTPSPRRLRTSRPRLRQLPSRPPSDQDRPQVERLVYSGEVVWVAAKDSRTVFFQEVRRRTSPGQPAPDLSVKLINPERDEEFVSAWCKACFPKISVSGFLGEDFSWDPEIVHAYCWELSWDSLFGRHAKQAKPAKPAEAEDEAEPAPVADAKPAVAEDKPPEQADCGGCQAGRGGR